jgi:flagellar basal-body rod protein FlgG
MVNRSLNTAATGMMAREKDISIISHNLANISSTGFKRYRAEFQDLLYQIELRPGSSTDESGTVSPTGVQIGLGTKLASTYPILEQGELQETTNNYDLAIGGTTGKGFFIVEMPDGTHSYTRAGSFKLSPTSEIVNDLGYPISPGITIPQNTVGVQINQSGQVYASISGTLAPQLVGQFDLADFPNPAGLQAIGANTLLETEASGQPILGKASVGSFGDIIQGWLETSNVNPVVELTTLITAQRGYELCSNIIKASDEMLQTINRLKQ